MDQAGKWFTTGEQHKDLSEKTIFMNPHIHDFIDFDSKHIVVAAKGMGKTLILRYKKERIENDKERHSGVLVIPKNEPLDYANPPSSVGRDFEAAFTDQRFWKDLWEASITMSIFSYITLTSMNTTEKTRLNETIQQLDLPKDTHTTIVRRLRNEEHRSLDPSQVLSDFLNLGVKRLQQFRNNHMQDILTLYKEHVQSGVYVFIDSFDQALGYRYCETASYSRIWKSGQLGLLSACWEINRQNSHIKVYTAIRQEAFSAFRNENKMAMRGSILLLKYTKAELHEMLLQLINVYESKSSLEDFLGCRQIHNDGAKQFEDPYDYIYRHTVGTPRSLAVIFEELSGKIRPGVSDKTEIVKRVVNKVSSECVSKDYLESEMSVFLDVLQDHNNRARFFSLIKKNIMTIENINAITKAFNATIYGVDHSPFCELYNIGLLGVIGHDIIGDRKVQQFRRPYEFDWNLSCNLPNSDYFFIHPSLRTYISSHNNRYEYNRQIVIGDGCHWTQNYQDTLDKEKTKIFVSYSSKDRAKVTKVINELKNTIDEKGLYHDCWLDVWKIRSGEFIQEAIEYALSSSHIMLLMVSKSSLQSNWVEKEWRTKFEEEINSKSIKVIAVVLDNTKPDELPVILKRKKVIRFPGTRMTKTRMSKLCESLCWDIFHHSSNTR